MKTCQSLGERNPSNETHYKRPSGRPTYIAPKEQQADILKSYFTQKDIGKIYSVSGKNRLVGGLKNTDFPNMSYSTLIAI